MAPKNPLGTIKDVADLAVATVVSTVSETVKDPVGAGQKVVGTAVGQAVAVAGAVGAKVPSRSRRKKPSRRIAIAVGSGRRATGRAPEEPGRPAQASGEEACGEEAPARRAAKKEL